MLKEDYFWLESEIKLDQYFISLFKTIQSYQTLYESSIAFGMRRALQAEQKRKEWQRLQQEKIEIEQQAAELAQQNVNPNPNNSENSNL